MKVILKYKSFFAYSENAKKYFFTEFGDNVNIVYGRNTSGKSTLIQAILYTFGINDVKTQLSEINNENPIYRLDCELKQNNKNINLTIIRDDENIYIKKDNESVKNFFGIGGDKSVEHSKLKEYLSNLFGFNFLLQQKDTMTKASIETIFLPYYIAQSTGWVYLRKSFGGLEFYKNFKNDYLDYYLGIENNIDRLDKQKLEKERETYTNEIKFLSEIETNNDELVLTQLIDENFKNKAESYIKEYQKKQDTLIEKEKEYVGKCNELSFYTARLSVLNKVKRNHKKQNPENGNCPICKNQLTFSTEAVYNYQQDMNDTEKQIEQLKEKQKKIQSAIHSLNKIIQKLKKEIFNEYEIVKKYNEQNITFENWIDNKSNSKLIENISLKLTALEANLSKTNKNLEKYKTEKEIEELRNQHDNKFASIFKKYLKELEVVNESMNKEHKYTTLYKSSIFPSQGVELHKTVLAHNFAFNQIIKNTEYVHRLPFLIDAIFKEDIDGGNKKLILDFVNRNTPIDTQLLVSIAYKAYEDKEIIYEYNKNNFNAKANLICIGDGTHTRAFLQNYNNSHDDLLQNTFEIMDDI
ncbi:MULTISPECIES: AAA family ATPase [Aliarcobacter]|uniref:AAA family ATPase n=1 Tax=Aliarcobacter TaxID=2321111 RepID=UPI0011DFB387|nr:AAA family ATPase [Aliarcobacter cryaerophilus]